MPAFYSAHWTMAEQILQIIKWVDAMPSTTAQKGVNLRFGLSRIKAHSSFKLSRKRFFSRLFECLMRWVFHTIVPVKLGNIISPLPV